MALLGLELVHEVGLVGLVLFDLALQVPLLDPLLARVELHPLSHWLIEAEVTIGESGRSLLYLPPSLVKRVVSLIELELIVLLTLAKHHQLLIFPFLIVLADQPFLLFDPFASITDLLAMLVVCLEGFLKPCLMLLVDE